MDPKRWKQIDSLVDAALELSEPEQAAFVAAQASGDEELEQAVLKLLAAQGETNQFLQHSAMRVAAQAMAGDAPQLKSASLVGKTIATYRVDRLIGAGGMGEVYLAFDQKMRRNVALKILPAEYGSHDERVKRFEIEARAVSRINHPNIVTIYDVGEAEGINYIATEFVEGKTLRELKTETFKLRNVIANSIQICDALSAAHEVGVIHRDIKPENIMIRKDGYAKILDFGVAKLTEIGFDNSHNFGNTTKGMIIGTPAYMSPAQVSGDPVDRRTDIWSCGVVLYEFLTGKNPFKGVNRQETFHAILSKEVPPPSSLNPEIPVELDQVLTKILRKDPDVSYQSAADLRADLRLIKRELDSSASSSSGEYFGSTKLQKQPAGRSRSALAGAGALLLLAIVTSVYLLVFRANGAAPGVDWTKARSVQMTNQPGTEFFPSLSADGKDIVYAAEENGSFDIFLLRVGSKKPRNLTPDSKSDDTMPAFSPDGNQIAFRSERKPKGIYVMDAAGDNPRRVADFGYHPSWSPDSKQLVVSTFGRAQPTVRGSAQEKLVVIDVQSGEKRDLLNAEATFPSWSPNGHRIAYWFYTGAFGRRHIATIPAGGGDPVIVAKDFAVSNWNPVWSPDGKFLYFVSTRAGNMNFWRVSIDEQSGQTAGEPEPVGAPASFCRHLTFSKDGKRMAYVQTNDTANIQGVNFDMKTLKTVGDPFWITQGDRETGRAELSPDGTMFVMRLARRSQDDIVTVNRAGSDWRDITNDEPFDRYVRWSYDNQRIAFASDRDSGSQIWISNADGTGLHPFTADPPAEFGTGFPVWGPDGRLAYQFDGKTWIYSSEGTTDGQEPVVLSPGEGERRTVIWDWSPDGKKLAGITYLVDGRANMVVYSFDTGKFDIVIPGTEQLPYWLPDSRHLVFSSKHSISIVDSETKAISRVLETQDVEVRSPFVSRDGKLLYYTGANRESDLWLLDLNPQQ